jgi:hypothetical protein
MSQRNMHPRRSAPTTSPTRCSARPPATTPRWSGRTPRPSAAATRTAAPPACRAFAGTPASSYATTTPQATKITSAPSCVMCCGHRPIHRPAQGAASVAAVAVAVAVARSSSTEIATLAAAVALVESEGVECVFEAATARRQSRHPPAWQLLSSPGQAKACCAAQPL